MYNKLEQYFQTIYLAIPVNLSSTAERGGGSRGKLPGPGSQKGPAKCKLLLLVTMFMRNFQ